MELFEKQRTDWQFAEPRLTSGAFGFLAKPRHRTLAEEPTSRKPRDVGHPRLFLGQLSK